VIEGASHLRLFFQIRLQRRYGSMHADAYVFISRIQTNADVFTCVASRYLIQWYELVRQENNWNAAVDHYVGRLTCKVVHMYELCGASSVLKCDTGDSSLETACI
jgi:hypothetical protein